jgi:penicillin V acylase-like amidase (Ntn superfamily)
MMLLKALCSLWFLVTLLAPAGCAAPDQTPPPAVAGACTSFYLEDGGHAVFGTNYDNQIWEGLLFVNQRGVTKTGWEAGTSGKYAHWTAAYGSVTFNLAGTQMAWAGMNEAGLAISTMWLGDTQNPAPDERPPLVSPIWVQYQLDTCATVEEVMANDARVRIADTVDHYLVCDRSGACAAVEFLEGRTVFHTGGAMPVKALTNHAYQEAVKAWQAGRLRDNALERFGIAADRVMAFSSGAAPSAPDYAFETLALASGQATGGSPTQWSIIFDMENLRVYWRTSRNAQIRSVDFAKLDLACGTAPQMIDVHAPLSGDISDRLGRYTFEANLQRTQDFVEKWGNVELSALELEVLERGLASFPCESPAAPYQEERKLIVSPLVGWAVRALLHRLWPVAGVLGLGFATIVGWRAQFRGRRG